jgi:hypothetical protein
MLDVRSKSMIKVQRPVVPVNTKLDAWLWEANGHSRGTNYLSMTLVV